MSCPLQERAHLRKVLQDRLKGKVSGFQDGHLDAMIKQGLTSKDRLAETSWSELSQQALLPRVLAQALLEAYNSSALNGPDNPEKQLHTFRPAAYGKRGVSECFHMAEMIIAANQAADALQQGSKHRGVSCHWSLSGKPWRARIHWLGGAVHLGCFATEDSAAHMYDRAAICVRGPEAMLNFPRQWYDNDGLPNGWVSSKAQLQSVLSKFTDNHGAATRVMKGYTSLPTRISSV